MKLAAFALAATLALTGLAHADPLKIGVVPGAYGDAVEVAATEANGSTPVQSPAA